MSLLKIDKLTHYYGTHKALDNVSLDIREHEVYGFIGRNGAGKTTTINIILSLLNQQKGTVFFKGQDVSENNETFKKAIGYVPDVPSFPGYMTPSMYLSFVYDLYDLPIEQKVMRIEKILCLVELEGVTKRISAFSRGMKQRLALASAMLHEPELLIMDEPTSALDPLGRKQVLDIIRTLKNKVTVFYSTHILEDAQKVCDRIGLIEHGKILLESSVSQIIKTRDVFAYYLETNEKPEALRSMLEKTPLTKDEKVFEDGVLCTLKDSADAQALIRFMHAHNLEIITLKKQERTLEDVFVEVLNENHHSV